MKFQPRKQRYVSSNCYFDVTSNQAYSYGWWRFVDVIDGLVVFNTYHYSSTTAKHQSNVRSLLGSLGISVDLFVNTYESLNSENWLNTAISRSKAEIDVLQTAIDKRGSHQSTNQKRTAQISQIKSHIKRLQRLAMRLERTDSQFKKA